MSDIKKDSAFYRKMHKNNKFELAKEIYERTNNWLKKETVPELTQDETQCKNLYFRLIELRRECGLKVVTLRKNYRTIEVFPDIPYLSEDKRLGFSAYREIANSHIEPTEYKKMIRRTAEEKKLSVKEVQALIKKRLEEQGRKSKSSKKKKFDTREETIQYLESVEIPDNTFIEITFRKLKKTKK